MVFIYGFIGSLLYAYFLTVALVLSVAVLNNFFNYLFSVLLYAALPVPSGIKRQDITF